MQVKHVHRCLSLHLPPLSHESLRDQFLALRDRFWPCEIDFLPCEIVFGLARSIFGLVKSFLALRDQFFSNIGNGVRNAKIHFKIGQHSCNRNGITVYKCLKASSAKH